MVGFKRVLCSAMIAVSSLGLWSSAQAALLGVVKSDPDVTLSGSTLLYDSTGVNGSTGLLRVVSTASVLNRGTSASIPQSYLEAVPVPDLMLSFAINNSTGALVANSTFNKVSIGFGNAALSNGTAFGFSWSGNIFAFGANANGTAFDARWSMTTDAYQNLAGSNIPNAVNLFSNGGLAGLTGGLIITNTGAISGTNIWGFDWVRGNNAGTSGAAFSTQISPYTTGIATTSDRLNSTIVADVFVPLPAAAWLLLSGLISLVPVARRKVAAG